MEQEEKSKSTYPILNLEPYSCEWIQIGTSNATVRWNMQPFFLKKSILWRGIIIHTEINDRANDLGFTREFNFMIEDEKFRFGYGKWKWMGGGIGNRPEIRCKTHTLKIEYSFHEMYLSLTEVPLDSTTEEIASVENPFIFFDPLQDVEVKVYPIIPKEAISNPYQVLLFEERNATFHLNSFAFFEKEDLIVDYWELGQIKKYEDEYYVLVKKEFLHFLYKVYNIANEDKTKLLQAILKSFNGEGCFKRFRIFLELEGIPFESGVRHD